MANQSAPALEDWAVSLIVASQRWRENCYLVRHLPSGDMTVIDPGGAVDEIVHAVEEGRGIPRHILLTHAHFDHVAAVAALRRQFDVPVFLHVADAGLLRHAPFYAMRFGGEQMEPAGAVTTFESAPDLRLGEERVDVLHIPGHTGGGVCYCFRGFAFPGDVLLRERIGRSDLPGGDAPALAVSVTRLLDTLPPETVLFPGHGGSWTVGEARLWWQGRNS